MSKLISGYSGWLFQSPLRISNGVEGLVTMVEVTDKNLLVHIRAASDEDAQNLVAAVTGLRDSAGSEYQWQQGLTGGGVLSTVATSVFSRPSSEDRPASISLYEGGRAESLVHLDL